MTKAGDPKRALLRGAIWALALRWSVRLLGFGNTLVMARLIRPEDYGIVAMAMLMVGLVQAMLDTGTATAILRMKDVTRDDMDSAWTLRLLEFLAVGVALSLVAYPAALYFEDSRLAPILWVFGACIAIQGFYTMGPVVAQRELNFSVDYKIAVFGKLVGVATTIACGVWLGDYRALVAGVASSYVISMVLSYLLHPYRSTWNTTRIAEIWRVTKWITFAGLANITLRKGDEFIAAKVTGAREFGLYNVGADLGQMPTGEVGPAIMRSFLPVLSTIQADAERTRQAVLKTIQAVNTLTAPIGVLFAVLAVPATLLLLGSTWQEAAKIVGLFAIISTIQIMLAPLTTLLTLRGHTKVQSHIVWAEFIVFLACALSVVWSHGIVGLAWSRMAASLFSCTLTATAACRLCGVSPRGLLLALYRPWLGAMVAGAVAAWVAGRIEGSILQLLAGGVAGGLVYTAWCIVSWRLSGRPEGLESTLYDRTVAWRKSRTQTRY